MKRIKSKKALPSVAAKRPDRERLAATIGSASSPVLMPRQGVTLMETLVAIGVLSVLLSVLVPVMHKLSMVERTLNEKVLATRELGNLCERVALLGRDAPLTEEALDELTLSDVALEHLEEPELNAVLTGTDDDLNAQQVTLSLTWKVDSGRRISPVRLTTWVAASSDTGTATEESE